MSCMAHAKADRYTAEFRKRRTFVLETLGPLFHSHESFDGDLGSFWAAYREKIGSPVPATRALAPDFLVISPVKAGTTWLAAHLTQHPEIFIPAEKEVRYFDVLWRFH